MNLKLPKSNTSINLIKLVYILPFLLIIKGLYSFHFAFQFRFRQGKLGIDLSDALFSSVGISLVGVVLLAVLLKYKIR